MLVKTYRSHIFSYVVTLQTFSRTFSNFLRPSPTSSDLPRPSSTFFNLLQPSLNLLRTDPGGPGNPGKPYETVRQGVCVCVCVCVCVIFSYILVNPSKSSNILVNPGKLPLLAVALHDGQASLCSKVWVTVSPLAPAPCRGPDRRLPSNLLRISYDFL